MDLSGKIGKKITFSRNDLSTAFLNNNKFLKISPPVLNTQPQVPYFSQRS